MSDKKDPQEVEQRRTFQEIAGLALLQWLHDSHSHDFATDGYDEEAPTRELKNAYAAGYNACRAQAMRLVAKIVFDYCDLPDNDTGCHCHD